MCGIIGINGVESVSEQIYEGLKRLEYRGYDSAGIATLANGALHRCRAEGKLSALRARLDKEPLEGTLGIGHTRWATHGAANETNAHPHITDKVAVVHNGIIENYKPLKEKLQAQGAKFLSDTDSEVIAHLFSHHLKQNASFTEAAQKTFASLQGAYAIGLIVNDGEEEIMIATRKGSPLAIGYGAHATYIGSDAFALAPFAKRITYLQDGDWALIHKTSAEIFTADGAPAKRETKPIAAHAAMVDKAGYRHFMAKEIHEQPEVLSHSIGQYVDVATNRIKFPPTAPNYKHIEKIYLVACGSAYFAAQLGRYWIEHYAQIPAEIDIASEFRYRSLPFKKNSLAIFISQSGETADTLAALAKCKEAKIETLGVINVTDSSMAREVDTTFPTYAGVEIGVASTKALMAQMVTLLSFALGLARQRGTLTSADETKLVAQLLTAPRLANEVLAEEQQISTLARVLSEHKGVLFIGRGSMWALALEGALKLKELSYIHAEGFAAGELKHGSIALIDETMPIITLAPSNSLFNKTISNMQEVMARQGKSILISDAEGISRAGEGCFATLMLPACDSLLEPFLYVLPLQLLAYHTARALGTDIDQPRNLAKSVTVE